MVRHRIYEDREQHPDNCDHDQHFHQGQRLELSVCANGTHVLERKLIHDCCRRNSFSRLIRSRASSTNFAHALAFLKRA